MWKVITVIISAIFAVASFLSLFFDIEDKIPITKRKFILLVSILALIVSCINLKSDVFDEKNGTENEPESIVNFESISDTNTGASAEQDQTEHATSSTYENILQAKPISSNPTTFSPITESDCLVPPTSIEKIYGSINAEGDYREYEFVPEIDGSYRFEFSDVPDGTDLRLSISNSGNERIKSDYDLDNGDGLTVTLQAGNYYFIKVEYYNNVGDFTLNIGEKKPIVDVSNYTKVIDSIQYTDQENDYSFTPNTTGVYRLEFSEVPDGTDLKLQVFNSGWEQIKSDYDMDNGDGLTVSLEAQHTYYIRVTEYENSGDYTLNIGHKKTIQDISSFSAVSDSIQYTHQEVDYSFTPATSGLYRFEFSNVPDGTDLKLFILNSGWEQIKSDYDLDSGDGISITLDAHSTYYIRVAQYEKKGSFTLNIGYKKEIIDISSCAAISDSIQYTHQENDYLFAPSVSGNYRFEFSDVPDATELKLFIFNSGWETIKSDYDLDNGDGVAIPMDVGHVYYVRVSQYHEFGDYTLNIIKIE